MKLFLIEWHKLKNHNFFWIGIGLYVLCIVLLVTMFGTAPFLAQTDDAMIKLPKNLAEAGFYGLPNVWRNVTYISLFLKFIPAFLVVFFLTNEYSYKTLRQNVIDGLSRSQFFWSKIMGLTFITLIGLVTLMITSLIVIAIYNSDSSVIDYFNGSSYLLNYFVEVFFMMILAFFMAILFRRSAIAIIVVLAYYYIIEPIAVAAGPDYLKLLLPAASSREFNLEPFSTMVGADGLLGIKSQEGIPTKHLLSASLYTFAFASGGFLLLKKRDI